jgi:hypothetical protein
LGRRAEGNGEGAGAVQAATSHVAKATRAAVTRRDVMA